MRRTELGAVAMGMRRCVPAMVLASLCACSAYDAHLLTGTKPDSVASADAAVDGGDGGTLDQVDASDDCRDSETASCTRPNARTACDDGKCLITSCIRPYLDCDTDADNGCEARLDSAAHCGMCGAACRYAHASGECRSGKCAFGTCHAGFADCDRDQSNGCETSLDRVTDCGSCGTTCGALDNAVAGCIDGACGIESCTPGFGDCNGRPEDGCEQRLSTARDCAQCGRACAPAHGEGSCDSGACVVTRCEQGYVDCNGRGDDGCEARADSAEHCGACGASCALPHADRLACERDANGAHCVLDHGCPEGARDCRQGAAENGCQPGYADCDGDSANGCEADLSRLDNCGACDRSCVSAGASAECRDGACVPGECLPGFARCDGEDACSSRASDAAHCGACDSQCSAGNESCAGGRCTGQVCGAGRADCDGDAANGCETDTNGTDNCGLCGRSCRPPAHATSACTAGACVIMGCESGYRDCDGDFSNGCEVDVRTIDDCGECGKSCRASQASVRCNGGQCEIATCNEGHADCNASFADGCESDLSLPQHCGSCGNACRDLPGALSSSCEAGACHLVCQAETADCDGQPATGCEARLDAATSCGACGNDCTKLARVRSATCEAGRCTKLDCEPGYADCNGDPSDGCERALDTTSDCGACNRACSPAHGSGSCTSGGCRLDGCDVGWDDCNDDAADGCEAQLSSDQNCGACNNRCAAGQCQQGQCACNSDSDCGDGSACCNGTCAETRTDCFPWPCLPGLGRPGATANCGGCDRSCALLWCCAVP